MVLVAKVIEQQHSQVFGTYRAAVFVRNIRAFLASPALDMFVALLGQLNELLSESWTSACAPKLQLVDYTLVKHLNPVWARACAWTLLGRWVGQCVLPLCVILNLQSAGLSSYKFFVLWDRRAQCEMNTCHSPAQKMRLQNPQSVWQLLQNWLWSDVPGFSLVSADSTWNCLSCKNCCGWNFWVTSCWFHALLCSTNM